MSDFRPKCGLCDAKHYTYEPHNLSPVTKSKAIENVTPVSGTSPVTKSKRGGARAGAGRKAVHGSPAARQRAYRQRKGAT